MLAGPAAAVLVLIVPMAQALTPLPPMSLDAYPPVMREAVAPALRAAESRPDDAAAAGALGRVLQAWEQWEAAHAVYSRAQALGPQTFDWYYLDAVVLQRLARQSEAAARLTQALTLSPGYLPAR